MMHLLLDPLYRGPFWGCLLISMLLGLIGTIVYLSKRPLLGELVAHSSYPGAILGLIGSIATMGFENPVIVLLIAFIFAWLGVLLLRKIQGLATTDSAMTLVLSGFFGLGVLISSLVQQKFAKFYRIAQGYLFGQITTMTDRHIWLYAICLALVLGFIYFYYPRLKLLLFDKDQSQLLSGKKIVFLMDTLICAVTVLGIRGIGVVLVSSFFVAPGIFATRFARTFKGTLVCALGLCVLISVISFLWVERYPMGPLIVLGLSCIAFVTLRKSSHESLS